MRLIRAKKDLSQPLSGVGMRRIIKDWKEGNLIFSGSCPRVTAHFSLLIANIVNIQLRTGYLQQLSGSGGPQLEPCKDSN